MPGSSASRNLNSVYFGAGASGIAAASDFATNPGRLDLAQASLLAGLIQSPFALRPLSAEETSGVGPRMSFLRAGTSAAARATIRLSRLFGGNASAPRLATGAAS